MLNIHRISEGKLSSTLGSGSFGVVKEVEVSGKKIAVKKIKFNKLKNQIKIQELTDMNDSTSVSEIYDAIREYCLYKICSML